MRDYCAKYPKGVRYVLSLADSENYLGRALLSKGNFAEAAEHFGQAIAVNEQLFAADAQQKQARTGAAYACGARGNALVRGGKLAEGFADEQKALSIYEEVAAANSDDAFLRRDYAETLFETGETLSRQNKKDEARAMFAKSLAVWSQMQSRGILSDFDKDRPEKIQSRIA